MQADGHWKIFQVGSWLSWGWTFGVPSLLVFAAAVARSYAGAGTHVQGDYKKTI